MAIFKKSGLFIKNLCEPFFSKNESYFTCQIIDIHDSLMYYFIFFTSSTAFF